MESNSITMEDEITNGALCNDIITATNSIWESRKKTKAYTQISQNKIHFLHWKQLM